MTDSFTTKGGLRQFPMSDEAFSSFIGGATSPAHRELLTRSAMRIHSLTELPLCGTDEAATGFFADGRRSPAGGHS